MSILPILIAGGAVVVVGSRDPGTGKEAGSREQDGVNNPPASGGTAIQTVVRQYVPGTQPQKFVGHTKMEEWGGVTTVRGGAGTVASGIVSGPGSEASTSEALRAAKAKLKAEVEAAESDAKAAATKILNDKLDMELTGEEDFETMFAAVGAKIGATGSAAACAMVGAGAISGYCGALGAIAGAYLGKEAAEFLEGAWDDVKDWASETWDGSWADDAASAVGGFIEGIGDWV